MEHDYVVIQQQTILVTHHSKKSVEPGWQLSQDVPVFFGPLHTTASSGSSSRKPIDMRARLFSASV